ncbi:Cullin repeat-like-containing domain protein [Gigaspora rosea]|uniref:Exocyst complex protein EXO70 n=1 Tax=Gigaspora rosea TaxID=44941 RepID=A0A397U0T0_9GLOM|nr:Cullin repeat-like-containing domain protein [Gigaspora rosea]
MERLDEDSADLAFLEENLEKTEELTEKMTSMLNVFDDRLVRLEASILPIHKSTQTLTKLVDNIDKTRNSVVEIIGYFDLVEREEVTIKRGPKGNDLDSYLSSIGKCNKAMEVLGAMSLKSSEKIIGQLKQILKAAMLQLEDLFRLWLTERSNPIEPLSFLSKKLEIPGIPSAPSKNLATLSSYLAITGPELGYTSEFFKVYIDVRSNYLVKSLTMLAQASISTAEKRSTPVYEKGTCGFNSYTDAVLMMFTTEYGVAEKILPSEYVSSSFRDTIQPSLENFVEIGKTLNNRVKKNMQTDIYLTFDMMETINTKMGTFDEIFKLAGKKDTAFSDLLHSLRAVAIRSFPEFLDEIKVKYHPTKTSGLPNDATVHELTITTLQHLKRLTDYPEAVESTLLTLGDAFNYDYVADVLECLAQSLDSKARTYKKPALTSIFLLNNYYYILKSIRTQFMSVLDPEVESKFDKMVKKWNDAYQDTWKSCFSNLMDYTWVRGGALKTTLGSNERQTVKEKFKNFNTEFDELYKAHKGYAMPDPELRNQVIRDIRGVLIPMYNRFLEKHQQSEFSKNPTKYIRYDSATLESIVNRLFDGSI